VAGTLIPFDVGSGVLTARYEYQAFGDRARWCGSCEEGHHRWYNQREYGTYTVDDVPLGSSLGGYGARHQVEMSYWGEIPVRFTGVGFVEDRERTNILYDRWPGTRQGVGMKIAGRPRPGWELELAGLAAWSEGESEGGLNLVVRMFDVLTNPMGAAR